VPCQVALAGCARFHRHKGQPGFHRGAIPGAMHTEPLPTNSDEMHATSGIALHSSLVVSIQLVSVFT
jgi:hypothetical protein